MVPFAQQRKAVAAGVTGGLLTAGLGALAGFLHIFGAFLPAPVTLVLGGVVGSLSWLAAFMTKNAPKTS